MPNNKVGELLETGQKTTTNAVKTVATDVKGQLGITDKNDPQQRVLRSIPAARRRPLPDRRPEAARDRRCRSIPRAPAPSTPCLGRRSKRRPTEDCTALVLMWRSGSSRP